MKETLHPNRLRLISLAIVLLLVSIACGLGGGNTADTEQNAPAANDAVDPAPANPQPDAEELPDEQPEEQPPAEDPPAEDPAPVTSTEPLKNTRLLPAIKALPLQEEDLMDLLDVEYEMKNDKEVDNTKAWQTVPWGDGREYVGKTGRVTGWNTYLERVNNVYAPFSYRTRLEVFETNDGAALAMDEEWLFLYNDDLSKEDAFEILDDACMYGDECVLAFYEENIAGTTDFNAEYHLVFRYRNVIVYVFAKGLEGTTTEQNVYDVADLMIDRLSQFE